MSRPRAKNSRLVYSTDTGRRCPECARAQADCICSARQSPPEGDGIARIQRESKGRGGKSVTVIRGLPLAEAELKQLGKALKQHCGVGGSVKAGCIELQGDQRATVKLALEARGFTAKIAGG